MSVPLKDIMQSDLFQPSTPSTYVLPMQQGNTVLYSRFLLTHEADKYFQQLRGSLAWRQDHIKLYGREVKIPRLQAWYGDAEASYQYSGLLMQPLPWTPPLSALKNRCEQQTQTQFNSVLANLYRDGQDSMGWHSDDEPELGSQPVIASLSLGQSRNFDFRHKHTGEKIRIPLHHGDLLVMSGSTQQYWQHGISKTRKVLSERINLTFRWVNS